MPTWYGWFEEYDADWKPAFTANKDKKTQKVIGTVEDIRSDVPFRMVQGSLLGWAKTGKLSVGKPVTNNYTVRRKEEKGVANAVAKLSISGTSFSWTDVTNGEGVLTIDPAIIPIRTKTPLVVHAEYPEISSAIKPQEISIPAECFGVSLFNNDILRSMRFNKFVDHDTEVDFPFIPDQEAPQLVVNVENKNIGTGNNFRQISITITNQGNGPCYRLLGKISSDNFAPLKDKLLIYGTIPPGHSETRSLTVEVPSPGWNNVSFPFSVNFWNANMVTLTPQNDSIEIKSIPRPQLVISTNIEKKQVAVPSINKGDAFCIVVSVTNTGTMPARNVKLTMLLPEDKSLKSFTAGIQSIADELVPGATTVCRFQLVSKRDSNNTNSPICTFEASEADPHCSEQKKVNIPINDLP
jgi:uncharacterized repeat protein (TIGR01451 family)